MHTIFFIATWALLLTVVILYGYIRALSKKHRRLEISLIDDCNATRDKWIQANGDKQRYHQALVADQAMIERAFKEIEGLKESHVDLLAKMAQYDNLAAGALSQLGYFLNDIRVSSALAASAYVRRAMDNLKQITAEK